MDINTTTLFNEKWNFYLEPRYYGLAISDENVIRFLDKEFEIETKENPKFQYSQIKLKFGRPVVYSTSKKSTTWEETIYEIINEK